MFFNEIVLCTMKSSQARMKSSAFASDEMKSASLIPTKSDFIAQRFHPTQVGFLPTKADFVEKSTRCLGRQRVLFSGGEGEIYELKRALKCTLIPRSIYTHALAHCLKRQRAESGIIHFSSTKKIGTTLR